MPALREQVQRFRFSGGIETKADPKTVPATQLLALENGVFSKAGTIKKRNGYESLVTIPGARRLAVRDNAELLAFTVSRSVSLQAGADQVSDAGPVYSAIGKDRPLVRTGTQQTSPDHATLRGVTVAAWEDSRGGVWWSTMDETTSRVLAAPTQADPAGQTPRCVPCGTNLHIYYAVPAQRRIMVLVVDPANPAAAVVPQILVSDLDTASPAFDAAPTHRRRSPAAIAWLENSTTSIRVGYVDQSGVLGNSVTGQPFVLTFPAARDVGSPLALAFRDVDGGVGDVFAVGLVSGGMTALFSFSGGGPSSPIASLSGGPSSRAVANPQRMAIAMTDASHGWIATEDGAAQPSNRLVIVQRFAIDTGLSVASSILRSAGLASRAFAMGGEVFAAVVHDTTFFNTYLTFRLSGSFPNQDAAFVPVGRHLPGTAAGASTRKHLPSAHVVGSKVAIALPMRERLVSESGDKFTETGLRLVSMDFDSSSSHQCAQLGRGLYLAGACPMHYDGRAWTELGFHVGPELIVAAPGTGGSMTSSTKYEYHAWYEWTDAQGEIHRGPISPGLLVTMGASETQVTLTLPTLRLTLKRNVRIMVARSLAAKTGKTAQRFRVSSLDPSTTGSPNGYIANDPTLDTVTFVDRMDDAALESFDELYTDGGIFSNDPAPIGAVIARGKQRLLASDPSDGSIVRYSQQLAEGYGVEWPPDLLLRVDPAGGDVTAIAVRDDRAIIWQERAISTFSGDGPDGAGAGGFSAVQLVPGDIGCTDPASVLVTSQGFLFKSEKGIYLLANDFSLVYIGAPVEAFNGQAVRRATAMPRRTQLVFLTDDGLTLLYDYLFGQWSTFTNHEGLDSAVANGNYYYLRSDGQVFRETIGQFSDAGQRITLTIETAWLHMLDYLQGFNKFFVMSLLGTWISPHQLGVQYQTDYTPGWTDSVWYDATGVSSSAGWVTGTGAKPIGEEPIAGTVYGEGEYGAGPYGGEPPGLYEWRLDLYEKGESIRFRFQDFEADGSTGASFELTELVLTGAAIGPVRRPTRPARSA